MGSDERIAFVKDGSGKAVKIILHPNGIELVGTRMDGEHPALTNASLSGVAVLPKLKVSENKHFLTTDSGQPFFWLGDTAWELFHRLTREEADQYLQNRAAKGFTLIQAVIFPSTEWLPCKRLWRTAVSRR